MNLVCVGLGKEGVGAIHTWLITVGKFPLVGVFTGGAQAWLLLLLLWLMRLWFVVRGPPASWPVVAVDLWFETVCLRRRNCAAGGWCSGPRAGWWGHWLAFPLKEAQKLLWRSCGGWSCWSYDVFTGPKNLFDPQGLIVIAHISRVNAGLNVDKNHVTAIGLGCSRDYYTQLRRIASSCSSSKIVVTKFPRPHGGRTLVTRVNPRGKIDLLGSDNHATS